MDKAKLYKEIREQVLQRDNHVCQNCGGDGELVHHLVYDFFDERLVPKKYLTTLCHKCHRQLSRPYPRHFVLSNAEKKDLETGLDTRTENVFIRLTPDEKHSLVQEAQKSGISISAFVRLLLRNWTDKITFEKK